MNILVTGAAGFIGYHLCRKYLEDGHRVVGLDSLDPYYSVALKQDRVAQLTPFPGFSFELADIADQSALAAVFRRGGFDYVVHMAAQAGVRYSYENPLAYVAPNLVGFANILEACRLHEVAHLVYASTSSVYGLHANMPFSESQPVDHPASFYAATKKSNELMAHAYSHIYRLPTTGLRFFTVYGPWGRPDMALFSFAQAILEGKPIPVFNHGQMERDFTYIDDIVDGVARVTYQAAKPDPEWDGAHPSCSTSSAPYTLYNIGNHTPVRLTRFIQVLEEALGRKAVLQLMPLQPGDVLSTFADVDALQQAVGFAPRTPIEVGIPRFLAWYRKYFSV